MLDRIVESAKFIQSKTKLKFKTGIVLGSGLGGLKKDIQLESELDYSAIPHFPLSTVEGHSGKLLIGKLNGEPILALQGRFHYYEGYSLKETTFPIRVFKAMGVVNLLLSNASGGLNPEQSIGDIMVITDHIHHFPDNPLRGQNYEKLGPRFPDMSEPYNYALIEKAREIGNHSKLDLKFGVYVGTNGPTYESRAEYKYFRYIGGDAVGMSTTAETLVAVHSGMRVFGASVISDLGVEGKIVEISHEEVQEVAAQAEPKLALLFKEMVKHLAVNLA
jgi:purine-nucleoside phosphorylase